MTDDQTVHMATDIAQSRRFWQSKLDRLKCLKSTNYDAQIDTLKGLISMLDSWDQDLKKKQEESNA